MPRKQPGQEKGTAVLIAAATIEMDHARYLYFVDGDGDVVRTSRLP